MIANKNHFALVVDDEEQMVKLMCSLLKINKIESETAYTQKEAIEKIKNNGKFDVVIVDYFLPDGHGEAVIKYVREKEPFTPILVFSGAASEIKIDSYAAGANFVIAKPFSEAEFIMVVRNLIDLSESRESLEDAKHIIEALGMALEARDTYTEGHGNRVADMSIALYDALGLNDRKQRHDLYIGALLHDVGKIGVPDSILKSTHRLTEEEYERVKQHSAVGYDICKGLGGIHDSLSVIRHHHERLDGSGYPDGLDDGNIPVLAQIVGLIDAYDAMTSRRSYRDKMSIEEAVSHLDKEAEAGKLNKEFLEVFKKLILK